MKSDGITKIRGLVEATERELHAFRLRRDQPGLSDFARSSAAIETTRVALRLNAYRRCLRLLESDS